MALDTIAILFGGLLLLIGILGGGFEVRELKLPKVGGFVRVASFVVGMLFILIPVLTPPLENLPQNQHRGPSRALSSDGAGVVTPIERLPNADPPPSQGTSRPRSHFSGISGAASLEWELGGVLYQADLVTEGTVGTLRVTFFDPNYGQYVTVDQDVALAHRSDGAYWIGANPRYAGTATQAHTYSPDILRLAKTPGGWQVMDICDNAGWCAAVTHADL